MNDYVLLFANVILLVIGQTLFKLGIEKSGGLQWLQLATSGYIWGGLALYGIATMVWFAVLSRLPLSVAYPLQSTAYVFGLLAAWMIFRETIALKQWLGVAIIIAGAYLIAAK